MADLFDDSGSLSGEEGDATGTFKPAQVPVSLTNGHNGVDEVEEADSPQDGVVSQEEDQAPEEDDLPPRYGGPKEKQEEEARGPRDDIKVAVLQYQKTADDYTYDVEVGS